jgi:hypothetical protein
MTVIVELVRNWNRVAVETRSRDSPGENEKTSIRMAGNKIEIRNVYIQKKNQIKPNQPQAIPLKLTYNFKNTVGISVNTGKIKRFQLKKEL